MESRGSTRGCVENPDWRSNAGSMAIDRGYAAPNFSKASTTWVRLAVVSRLRPRIRGSMRDRTVNVPDRTAARTALLGFIEGDASEPRLWGRYPVRTDDVAVREIGETVYYALQNPTSLAREHGDTTDDSSVRALIARCETFLATTEPWPWPTFSDRPVRNAFGFVLNAVTLGIFRSQLAPWGTAEPRGSWPFSSRSQFERAREDLESL